MAKRVSVDTTVFYINFRKFENEMERCDKTMSVCYTCYASIIAFKATSQL